MNIKEIEKIHKDSRESSEEKMDLKKENDELKNRLSLWK